MRPILNVMKIFATATLAVLVVAITGCGGSASSSATSPSPNSANRFVRELHAMNREIHQSPQSVAFQSADSEFSEAQSMAAVGAVLRKTVPKATALIGYLRSLSVPVCLEGAKERLTNAMIEVRSAFRGYLPVIRTGNKAAVSAYNAKAHLLLHDTARRVNRRMAAMKRNGGDGSC
jgi:hypothetical protein